MISSFHVVTVIVKEIERYTHRGMERDRDRERERQRDTVTERDRERERERDLRYVVTVISSFHVVAVIVKEIER